MEVTCWKTGRSSRNKVILHFAHYHRDLDKASLLLNEHFEDYSSIKAIQRKMGKIPILKTSNLDQKNIQDRDNDLGQCLSNDWFLYGMLHWSEMG